MKTFQAGVLLPSHTSIYLLHDDGRFPNNPNLPVVSYEHAFQISNEDEGADHIEKILEENLWHHPWRDGIYNYHHYHSTAHEVLVCYAGDATVQLGGDSGVEIHFKPGDALLLPSGTAHKCLHASLDFKCIGAYPDDQMFDINYGKEEERSKAIENIHNTPLPKSDPVYGAEGPLIFHWGE